MSIRLRCDSRRLTCYHVHLFSPLALLVSLLVTRCVLAVSPLDTYLPYKNTLYGIVVVDMIYVNISIPLNIMNRC